MDWQTLAEEYGPQDAPYRSWAGWPHKRADESRFKVRCAACGKVCTKARGGEVLTRKAVYCGKCHDETRHGACSNTTHYHQRA